MQCGLFGGGGGGGRATDPKGRRNCYKFPDSLRLSPPLWSAGIVTKELCDREIFGKCPEGRLADAAAAQQEDDMISATISKKYKIRLLD